MSHPVAYNAEFYEAIRAESYSSATHVVPILLEYVSAKSVVDVGCGAGCWLRAFQEAGVSDVAGVEREHPGDVFEIDTSHLHLRNLKRRFSLDRTFDLALCLEVAEHLPASSASSLVDSLTSLAPVILFSAAIPGQGGTRHLNEQWPLYWVKLFEARRWCVADCIRKRVWSNGAVACWYAQNMLIFVRRDVLQNYQRLAEEVARTDRAALSLVHPEMYMGAIAAPYPETFRHTLLQLPRLARNGILRRLRKDRKPR